MGGLLVAECQLSAGGTDSAPEGHLPQIQVLRKGVGQSLADQGADQHVVELVVPVLAMALDSARTRSRMFWSRSQKQNIAWGYCRGQPVATKTSTVPVLVAAQERAGSGDGRGSGLLEDLVEPGEVRRDRVGEIPAGGCRGRTPAKSVLTQK